MWISKQLSEKAESSAIENGRVTLNDKGEVEAVSTGVQRSVKVYSPYGYAFSLPSGSEILMARSAGEQISFATQMNAESINEGEIKITCASGGYIYLKNDGSVIINGLKINRKGVIE
ncbi:MAG: hypothetical protein ACI4V4_04865 [Eubacterium sp.]